VPRPHLVREPLLAEDRHRRGLVLGGAEVAEHARPALAPEPLVERLGDLRPRQLVPAPAPEDAADQRRDGDQILAPEPVRALRVADRGVLAGHLRRVELCLGDVAVDAGDVVVDVAADELALGAQQLRELVALVGEVGLGIWRDPPLLGVHRGVRAAGEARQLAAAGMAQHVHEEQAVLGAGVAEPEHRAVARPAVDVRDAEGLVAHDRHVRARGGRPLRLPGPHAEARVLEVAGDLRRGQARVAYTRSRYMPSWSQQCGTVLPVARKAASSIAL
jgi:hypothetical protein